MGGPGLPMALGSAASAVDRAIRENPAPDGFTARVGGQVAAQREAFSGLGLAALLAWGYKIALMREWME